jgi:hypothetical protein
VAVAVPCLRGDPSALSGRPGTRGSGPAWTNKRNKLYLSTLITHSSILLFSMSKSKCLHNIVLVAVVMLLRGSMRCGIDATIQGLSLWRKTVQGWI